VRVGRPAWRPDPQANLVALRPGASDRPALDREGGLEGGRGLREDREVLVGAGIHLVAAGLGDGRPVQLSSLGQDPRPAVAETLQERGRSLDVGQQEGHQADRQGDPARCSRLRAELSCDEADRHDAVLLRRPQQPGARPDAGVLVLEAHLVEARQRIPDMGLVVDRQAPAAPGVDVGEGAVRQLRARLRAKRGHGWHNSRDLKCKTSSSAC